MKSCLSRTGSTISDLASAPGVLVLTGSYRCSRYVKSCRGEELPGLARAGGARGRAGGHRRMRKSTRIRRNQDPEDNIVVTQEDILYP